MKRVIIPLLFGLAAGLAAAPVAVAGTAETRRAQWTYQDDRDTAGPNIDVVKTSLSVRRGGMLRVTINGREFVKNRTDEARLFFDTDRRNNGPEYKVFYTLGQYPGAEVGKTMVQRVDTWEADGRVVTCRRLRAFTNFNRDTITFDVPRSCLGWPSAVRWSGYVGTVTRNDGDTLYGKWDDFPSLNTFPDRWVA